MRVSYNWLKELVPELIHSPAEVAELLTLHSFETEVVQEIAIDSQVVIARITALEKHPNADRLRLATIDTGSEAITVVCGAPNIAEGDFVPFSPPGAKLYDEEGNVFTLKPATIRGVASPGMLNSPRELGLAQVHTGILQLPKDEAAIGASLAEQLPADTVLDVDLTPNRAHDCYSHIGIAREIAALLELTVAEPKAPPLPDAPLPEWKITVADNTDTPRYLAAKLTGVTVQPSPLWLQARLFAVGARPVNNLVDITNYVLFEQGNPSHMFDAKKLPAAEITVKKVQTSTTLQALDTNSYTLAPGQLAITSHDTPVAIAGIIGGQSTEVDDATTDVLLEVANFNPFLIQQTSADLKILTESSRRFSKGVPIGRVGEAAQRLLTLLQEVAGATVAGVHDTHPTVPTRQAITFDPVQVAHITGADVPVEQCAAVLERLRCEVDSSTIPWQVTPPADRLDLTISADVTEEIVRVVGLENIAATSVSIEQPAELLKAVQVREYIRDALVAAGYTEVYNQPFEVDRYAAALDTDSSQAVTLANPVAPEQTQLRTSLLPRLLWNMTTNKGEIRKKQSMHSRNVFEIGSTWRQGKGGRVAGIVEEECVAGVIVDQVPVETLVRDILTGLNIDTTPRLELWQAGGIPGKTTQQLKLPPLQYFWINLTQLLPLVADSFTYAPQPTSTNTTYAPISPYPPVLRDLSLRITPETTIEAIQAIIERVGKELVADVDLFDEFEADSAVDWADEGFTKSVAFHITYQAFDRTLTDDEIAALHNAIIATLKEELGVQVRE